MQALVGPDPCERRLRAGVQHHSGVARQLPGIVEIDHAVGEQLVDDPGVDIELDEARPPRIGRHLVPVLLGGEAEHARFQPQWEVLGHDDHVGSLVGEIARHGQNAVVVRVVGEGIGQPGPVLVVDLHADRPAHVIGRNRGGERTVARAEVLEEAEALACRPAEFGMMALGLEFGEDHQWDDDSVLLEAGERTGVGEEDRGVEHVFLGSGPGALHARGSSGAWATLGHSGFPLVAGVGRRGSITYSSSGP